MKVTVSYAQPHLHWQRELEVADDATVQQALAKSGFAQAHPPLRDFAQGVGINGKIVSLDHALNENDRVEIYRPLSFDPMVSRRRRAAHKARKAALAKQGA